MKKLNQAIIGSAIACAMFSCSSGSGNGAQNYLCVQLDDSKMWSIVDVADGKILKEDEFANPVSAIVNDAFFTKNSDGKYVVFTLDNTASPLNENPYDYVTGFNRNGYAVAVTAKHPTMIVDTKGATVATLPTNIQPVGGFADNNLAPFVNSRGLYGYINTKGEIVIQPRFADVRAFSDGLAVVVKDRDGEKTQYQVIDASGNAVFTFNSGVYPQFSDFSDGYATAVQNGHILLVNKEGEKSVKVCEGSSIDGISHNAKYVTYRDGSFYGLKDMNGEIVIRAKYQALSFVPGGNLMAENQNDKFGIVDVNDETVVPFQYDWLQCISPDRYLTKVGSDYVLVNGKEKDVCKRTFAAVEGISGSSTAVMADFASVVENAAERIRQVQRRAEAAAEEPVEIDFNGDAPAGGAGMFFPVEMTPASDKVMGGLGSLFRVIDTPVTIQQNEDGSYFVMVGITRTDVSVPFNPALAVTYLEEEPGMESVGIGITIFDSNENMIYQQAPSSKDKRYMPSDMDEFIQFLGARSGAAMEVIFQIPADVNVGDATKFVVMTENNGMS